MSHAYTETAESIVEHAHAITRLGRGADAAGYDAAVARHVHAMRVLAAPHVDPALDRGFHRALTAAAGAVPGVVFRLVDGLVGVIVDSADGAQHRFALLSPAQIDRRGDFDPFA